MVLIYQGFSSAKADTNTRFFSIDRTQGARHLPIERAGATGDAIGMRADTSGARGNFFPIDPQHRTTFKRTDQPGRRSLDASMPPAPHLIRHIAPSVKIAALTLANPDLSDLVGTPRLPDPADDRLTHIWPVDTAVPSRVTSGHGWRDDPFTGKRAFHAGVDIAAKSGTRVVATAPGRVAAVGEHPRLGRYVMIAYLDGSVGTYGHLKRITVATDQAVRLGQVVGAVGSTGRSTGPHLDFALKVDGRPVDPLPLLRRPRPATASGGG
jgi:murein DD-endopeptidase MepM/ murein hydrolase activator NlpD